jgi:hypothetical protein
MFNVKRSVLELLLVFNITTSFHKIDVSILLISTQDNRNLTTSNSIHIKTPVLPDGT